MIKVKPYFGGRMGMIANGVLEQLVEDKIVEIDTLTPDIVFSASWPTKIDRLECAEARMAAINIHTGLLPEGRGSNPLNWAIVWGKDKTGITIHHMSETIDAGDILMQHEVPIFESDTIIELRERIETFFPIVIVEFFKYVHEHGELPPAEQQDAALVSYAQKRRPSDSMLNLKAPPLHILNLWRSCHPIEYPAFVMRGDKKLLVTRVSKFLNKGVLVEFEDNSAQVIYG